MALYITSIPGMFLGVKILNQTSAAFGILEFYCAGSSAHKMNIAGESSRKVCSNSSIQVIQLKSIHEYHWRFLADLQARTLGKFNLSISVIRNSLRTVIATVLQPTYLAIQSRTLFEGNKSRLKRCNPTRKVVFTTIFFQLVFRGVNSVK